jgi:hypothetical protein
MNMGGVVLIALGVIGVVVGVVVVVGVIGWWRQVRRERMERREAAEMLAEYRRGHAQGPRSGLRGRRRGTEMPLSPEHEKAEADLRDWARDQTVRR